MSRYLEKEEHDKCFVEFLFHQSHHFLSWAHEFTKVTTIFLSVTNGPLVVCLVVVQVQKSNSNVMMRMLDSIITKSLLITIKIARSLYQAMHDI
jgi:hypothetical protein